MLINQKLGNFGLILLLFGYFALLVWQQSPYLDDIDSANFALGVQRFSPAEARPHPPGYSLYIMAGKALNVLTHDPRSALTLLSAISGAVTLLFTYLLLQQFAGNLTALLACSVLAATPFFFLFSVQAMTEIPGLALFSAALWSLTNAKFRPMAYLIAGLLVGVRPHLLLFLLPVLWLDWRRNRSVRLPFLTLAGVVCALIPIVMTDGLAKYADALTQFFCMRFSRPEISPLAKGATWLTALRRPGQYALFFLSGLGFDGKSIGPAQYISALLLGALPAALFLNRRNIGTCSEALSGIGAGLLLYLTYFLLFMPPFNSRYMIPVWFVLVLLGARALHHRPTPKWAIAGSLALIVSFATRTAALTQQLHAIPPPAYAQMLFLKEEAASKKIGLAFFRHSYFRYYWPDAPILTAEETKCESLPSTATKFDAIYTGNFKPCRSAAFTTVNRWQRPTSLQGKTPIELLRKLDKLSE